MDISLYFQPVDFSKAGLTANLTRHSLGYYIRKDSQKASWTGKSGIKVAIFGVPASTCSSNRGTLKAPDEDQEATLPLQLPGGIQGNSGPRKPETGKIGTGYLRLP